MVFCTLAMRRISSAPWTSARAVISPAANRSTLLASSFIGRNTNWLMVQRKNSTPDASSTAIATPNMFAVMSIVRARRLWASALLANRSSARTSALTRAGWRRASPLADERQCVSSCGARLSNACRSSGERVRRVARASRTRPCASDRERPMDEVSNS